MERRTLDLPVWDAWVRRRPWVADGVLALALTAALAPASVSVIRDSEWPPALQGLALAVVAVGHATVAARRTWPVAAHLVCVAVMAAVLVAPDLPAAAAGEFADVLVPPVLLPSTLVYPVVLYAVAAYAPRPWPLLALALGLGGALVTTVRLGLTIDPAAGQPAPGGAAWPLVLLGALVAMVVAPWGLGRYRSVRTAYVQALEERERRAEEFRAERAAQAVLAERARIAREMHDVVAHSLAVMVRQAEGGRFVAVRDPQAAAGALATVAVTGREALAEMRAALGLLRGPGEPEGEPQPTVEDIGALVQRLRDTGLEVSLATTGTPMPLDRAASLAAYRVVQEGLTNVVKHAGPDAAVAVTLTWGGDGLDVAVTDGGAGTGPLREPPDGAGFGLTGMRERVTAAGGDLEVGPRLGGGFAVRAHLPARAHLPVRATGGRS